MSIAEYERELVRERTALKLERKFGRPAKLNAEQAALARRMKANGGALPPSARRRSDTPNNRWAHTG